MSKSTRAAEKAQYERKIFEEFGTVAKGIASLEIDLDSITSEEPPRPDISCIIGGQKHYFEITEITDEDLAKSVSISVRDMVITGCAFSQDSPLIKAFTGKAKKTYPGLDGPLELLAYYDKQYPPPPGGVQESTLRELYWMVQGMTSFGPWNRL